MERIVALDVGDRRIGVAVSDALGLTAQGVKVIQRTSLAADISAIMETVNQYQAVEIVIGLPLNMNGSKGPQAEAAEAFGRELEGKSDAKIAFVDERLTTAAARRTLLEADTSRKKRKTVVDMLAAQLILETYLGRKKRTT